MTNINFTPFPVLTTERLILRQIIVEDLNEFFILKSDQRLLKGYGGKAKTYEEARQSLRKIDEEIGKNEWIIWGITFNTDNKLIGSICFWNIDREKSKAEIGYELMFDWHGKGIMSEAIKAVAAYGFDTMKLDLIEALPYEHNVKSTMLLEKNGFIMRGSFKENSSAKEQIIYEYGKEQYAIQP